MKYNKKGFTLVELIVVIAIMAVLAGVVSGATVGILNKKTDEVNYIYNGKQISAQIVSWAQEVVERPAFFTELTGDRNRRDRSFVWQYRRNMDGCVLGSRLQYPEKQVFVLKMG